MVFYMFTCQRTKKANHVVLRLMRNKASKKLLKKLRVFLFYSLIFRFLTRRKTMIKTSTAMMKIPINTYNIHGAYASFLSTVGSLSSASFAISFVKISPTIVLTLILVYVFSC